MVSGDASDHTGPAAYFMPALDMIPAFPRDCGHFRMPPAEKKTADITADHRLTLDAASH